MRAHRSLSKEASRWPQRVAWGLLLAALVIVPKLFAQADAEKAAAGKAEPAVSSATGLVAAGGVDSTAAFAQVALVLRHPRCLNCHPAGNFPRQTDLRIPHAMKVARGKDDHGEVGMRCSTCHAAENVGPVPGAPLWALAPIEMAWEGLDDHQLAEQLKDKARNGGKTLAEIDHHLAEDALVGWGWAPGEGRQTPPISREEFVAAFRAWVAAGAKSPPPGTGKAVDPRNHPPAAGSAP